MELQEGQISEDTHTHTHTHTHWELWSYWDLSSAYDLVSCVSVLPVLPALAVGLLIAEETQRLGAFQLDLKLLQETRSREKGEEEQRSVGGACVSRARPSLPLVEEEPPLTSFHLGSEV